jgi:CRISPR-associated protein Csd2
MNRYDFIVLFDAKDANPNGDPDAGNLPRVDPETGHGLVTDVCLKRKIRNFVGLTKGEQSPFEIYFKEKAVLNNTHLRAYQELEIKSEKQKEAAGVRDWMCKNFYDIRTFGAVMSTEVNCGQVRGPVQLSFSRSIDPIITSEHAITRSSVTNEKDLEKERTMGRKFTIPYGLYRAHGFVNPFLAEQTGFGEGDLDLLWESIKNAFQFDQSAARPAGSMGTQRLIVFKHDNQLGKAASHKLFEAVTIKAKEGVDCPRTFSDYDVTIDLSAIPAGVEVIELI